MAEYSKDADDRFFESLFATEPLPDDGFSARIVKRIRRRLWLRRCTLATALAVGGAIGLKPALALSEIAVRLLQSVPAVLPGVDLDAVPSAAMLAGGAILFLLVVVGVRFLED